MASGSIRRGACHSGLSNILSHLPLLFTDVGYNPADKPVLGSNLPPGQYVQKTFTEELLHKQCSLKGPYELFSGRRDDRIKTGAGHQPYGLFSENARRPKMGPGKVMTGR